MKKLPLLIDEAAHYKAEINVTSPAISQGSVGWHLQHLLLVISQIVSTVKKSDPADYQPKFNFWRLVIFTTKKIPRGKVKAPKGVTPANEITDASITEALELAMSGIKELNYLPQNHFFVHPIFGKVNVKATIPFLQIHTNHHLKIIRDILKAQS